MLQSLADRSLEPTLHIPSSNYEELTSTAGENQTHRYSLTHSGVWCISSGDFWDHLGMLVNTAQVDAVTRRYFRLLALP
jgi:hypothetical protein